MSVRFVPKAEREAAARRLAEEEENIKRLKIDEIAQKNREFFNPAKTEKVIRSVDPRSAAHSNSLPADSELSRLNLLDLNEIEKFDDSVIVALPKKNNPELDDTFALSSIPEISIIPSFGRLRRDDLVKGRKQDSIYDKIAELHGGKRKEFESDPKNLSWKNKLLEEMTERDWKIFREDSKISVKGGRVPPPFRSWLESPLPKDLLRAIQKAGYSRPTSVQMQAIPIAMQCQDMIAVASTGSGKTAAFILPILVYIKSLPALTELTAQNGPYALVLAPTRELAIQIESEAKKFCHFCETIRVCCIVGGRSVDPQAYQLASGAELVVATPGRLADLIDSRITVLEQCFYVVLDEADRMVEMGHEAFVHAVLDAIPASNLKSFDEIEVTAQEQAIKEGKQRYRITQMFSATMPPSVEKLAKKYLRNPAIIAVGEQGTRQDIDQHVQYMTEQEKRQALRDALAMTKGPIMVFANSKKGCDFVGRIIEQEGYRVVVLHSGKQQQQREEIMASFRDKRADVLVATDVAGRGIDVEGVQHVINFEMPKSIEDYTHRIGRTGRAGKKGLATTFLTAQDSEVFYDLKNFLVNAKARLPPELENSPEARSKPGTDKNIIY